MACTVLGIVGYSGSGKTTLLTRLLPWLKNAGLRVAAIKHSHHPLDVDRPGKDSDRLRRAGAAEVMLIAPDGWAVMSNDPPAPPAFEALLARLDRARLDLVLVEGFKTEPMPKLEVHRPALDRPLLATTDPHVIAVIADAPPGVALDVPMLDLNRPEAAGEFIRHWLARQNADTA